MDDGRGLRFGTVAEEYDRYRPGPPDEAASLFGDLASANVLEVGAGTGKLTRFLLGLGATLSVIEPDDDMRKVLLRQSPEVTALAGSAEAIPVGDASFDVVASSSAWHWFRQPEAANELARVLRDDGTLFVLWNGFSRDVAWMADLTKLRERSDDANARPRGWRAELDPGGPFVDAHDVTIHWTWPRTVDQVVGLFGTYSGAIVQSDENRRVIGERVRERLIGRVHDGVVMLPMTLRGTVARRRAR